MNSEVFLSTVMDVWGKDVVEKCRKIMAESPNDSPNVVLAKATTRHRNLDGLKKPIDSDIKLTYRA
jgi:hypothetical protein